MPTDSQPLRRHSGNPDGGANVPPTVSSDAQLARAFDAVDVLIAYLDPAFRFLRVNHAFAQAVGAEPPALVGRSLFDVRPQPDEESLLRQAMATGRPYLAFEKPFVHPDRPGETTWWDWTIQPVREATGATGALLVGIDRTERVRNRVEAERHEARFRVLLEDASDTIFVLEPESGRFLATNPATRRLLGREEGELAGLSLLDFANPGDGARLHKRLRRVMLRGEDRFLVRLQPAPERTVMGSISANVVPWDDGHGVLCVCRDVTSRERAEERLRGLNRALKTLSRCNQVLVHAETTGQLLERMSRALIKTGGYAAARVLLLDAATPLGFEEAAASGHLRHLPALDEDVGGATLAQVLREAISERASRIFCHRRRGLPLVVLPLVSESEGAVGALVLAANHHEGFEPKEMALLNELAQDMAYGIGTLRIRREQEEAEARLEKSYEKTVQAVAAAAEMRDPYTAGHQRRVATLAAAIARRMGLSDEEIKGIHLAGLVHDLGKIAVPAEILNRPGTLSAAQFEMIKEHARAGHEILHGVEMPWPVADMVLQHHERLDGSGYPAGLADGAILPGARVLAVADVVEAISSHRPYRPCLGTEAALAEIEANRGRLYDSDAVDACLALFREDGYELS